MIVLVGGMRGSPRSSYRFCNSYKRGCFRKSLLRSRTGKTSSLSLSRAAQPRSSAGKTAGLEDQSDLTGAGADACPNGFFLLLLPTYCHCLEISPASPGRRRRTGQRTSPTSSSLLFSPQHPYPPAQVLVRRRRPRSVTYTSDGDYQPGVVGVAANASHFEKWPAPSVSFYLRRQRPFARLETCGCFYS